MTPPNGPECKEQSMKKQSMKKAKKKRASEVMWMAWDEDTERFESMTGERSRQDCHDILIEGAGANRNMRVVRVRITELPPKRKGKK